MPPVRTPFAAYSQPDPNWASVTLLMSAARGAIDLSLAALTVTANNNAAVSATQAKFGGSSFSFLNGGSNNAFYTFSSATGFAFGAGDYTWECWIYPQASGCDFGMTGAASVTDRGFMMNPKILVIKGDSSNLLVSANSVSLNAWSHIAVTRASNTTRSFINGTVDPTTALDAATLTAAASRAGASGQAIYELTCNGYLDQIRVTKGVARYTANFTAPIAPFPTH